jgi:type IV secretion system protein VirD4
VKDGLRQAGIVLAILAAAAAFWLVAASVIFLVGTGLWGHPSLPWWSYPYAWATYAPYATRSFVEGAWIASAAFSAAVPLVALARWQWRRWGGIAGIGRRTLNVDRIRRGTTHNHGTAEWMPLDKAAELFPSEPDEEVGGVVVGELDRVDLGPVARVRFDPRDPEGRHTWGMGGKAPLMIDPCRSGTTHSIVTSGGGGYKSTALVTTLLTWRKSMVVLDPSEELADLTGKAIEKSGRAVHRLQIGGMGPNVLAGIDINDPMAETRLRAVVARIIGPMPRDESGNAGKFKRWGRTIITALLADLVWRQDIATERKTLRTLRAGLAVSEQDIRDTLRFIHEESPSALARSLAGGIYGWASETFTGAHGNATDDTEWLASKVYADLVSGDAFHLPDIVKGEMAVFIQLPLEALQATPAVARVLVGCSLDAVFAAKGKVNGRVFFPLDEAVLLGPEPSLKTARDQGRKSKITLQLFYQSEGQIEEVWGKPGKQAWFDGVSWRSYAGIQNLETAKDISATLGTFGAVATSKGENKGSQGRALEMPSASSGSNLNEHEISREVAKPHELLQEMRPDERITLVRSERPIRHGAAIGFRRQEIVNQLGSTNYESVMPWNPEYVRDKRRGSAPATQAPAPAPAALASGQASGLPKPASGLAPAWARTAPPRAEPV